jgi:hypothetical protein
MLVSRMSEYKRDREIWQCARVCGTVIQSLLSSIDCLECISWRIFIKVSISGEPIEG